MRKERLIGKERYAGYLLTFMQGLLIALLAVFFLNQQYMVVWRAYPQSGEALTVYLKNVAAEKQRDTQNFLLRAAEEQELFIVRMDEILDNSGSFQGYKFGVYGNTESSAGIRSSQQHLGHRNRKHQQHRRDTEFPFL